LLIYFCNNPIKNEEEREINKKKLNNVDVAWLRREETQHFWSINYKYP
jgi:hypothetical protein